MILNVHPKKPSTDTEITRSTSFRCNSSKNKTRRTDGLVGIQTPTHHKKEKPEIRML
jgi:hypothetical protein